MSNSQRAVAQLKPYPRNARTHSRKQIKQIAASIERFGFTNPVLVSDDGEIIAGHGRVEAARLLGGRRCQRWRCRISPRPNAAPTFSPTTSSR